MSTEDRRQPWIRWMIRRDLDRVVAIENASTLPGEKPWDVAEILAFLGHCNGIGMVVDSDIDAEPIGFMLYRIQAPQLELLKLAVAPEFRRQGYGRRLVLTLQSKLRAERRRVGHSVRERNLPAQLFLRGLGFRAEAVKRRYFLDTREDGYRLVYHRPEELACLPTNPQSSSRPAAS